MVAHSFSLSSAACRHVWHGRALGAGQCYLTVDLWDLVGYLIMDLGHFTMVRLIMDLGHFKVV